MKQLRNTLKVKFVQDTTKTVKQGEGTVEKQVKHTMTFEESTKLPVNSANFSDWLLARLLNYQLIQKLQGKKERFDTTLPIDMTIEVNGQEAAASIKFSTNPTTLKRNLEQYPTVIAAVFNPQTLAFGTERKSILAIAEGVVVELAPAGATLEEIQAEMKEENADGQPLISDVELVED